jgi:hypothetical protein
MSLLVVWEEWYLHIGSMHTNNKSMRSSVVCTTQRSRNNTTFKVNITPMLDHQTKFNIASLISVYTKRVR